MLDWIPALPGFLVALTVLLIPGALIVVPGWGWRSPTALLLIPAVSLSVIGLAAVAAPIVGISWTPLPVVGAAAVLGGIAFLVRRRSTFPPATTGWRSLLFAAGGLLAAGTILTAQFAAAFGAPTNVAQRFDNVVHLNTVEFVLQTGNASPFHIGATSDIGFYPSTWHAVTALAAELTGSDVSTAVNAANLAVVGLVWPASVMALAGALFTQRRVAFIAAAALSTGFGAFPALFFNWGVLYPNVVGYAMAPAALALTVIVVRRGPAGAPSVLAGLLLMLVTAGAGLAHPNAFLALMALGGPYAVAELLAAFVRSPSRRAAVSFGAVTVMLVVVGAAVWHFGRTPADHSGWAPWQNPAQALGEGLLVSPRGYFPSFVAVLLIAIGVATAFRHPRHLPLLVPFAVAVGLFVVASGFPIDHWLRNYLTNPWYNDSNRLAALIPLAAIPVATLGAVSSWQVLRGAAARTRTVWTKRVLAAAATLVLFSMSVGGNTTVALAQVREAYTYTDESPMLSTDERSLLERLAGEVPASAVVIGSPRTGASLAYAISHREVARKHIFGSPPEAVTYLNANLRNIDTDPAVCSFAKQERIGYVLDFGTRDVIDDPNGTIGYEGVVDLTPGTHLVLVDSEGPDARLFRIDGC